MAHDKHSSESPHDHPKADDFRFMCERHQGVFTCTHVWKDGLPILLVSHDEDGDWQFLCGAQSHTADEGLLVCLEHVVARDPSVNGVADICALSTAVRDKIEAAWRVEDATIDHIHATIDEYDWWVGLFRAEENAPAFAYTVGLYEKFLHPEVIVFGLPLERMQSILNTFGALIRSGKRFRAGEAISDVLKDNAVRLRKVSAPESYDEYFGYGSRYYGGRDVELFQLVWPDKQGRFPGDPGVDGAIAKLQPLLP